MRELVNQFGNCDNVRRSVTERSKKEFTTLFNLWCQLDIYEVREEWGVLQLVRVETDQVGGGCGDRFVDVIYALALTALLRFMVLALTVAFALTSEYLLYLKHEFNIHVGYTNYQ